MNRVATFDGKRTRPGWHVLRLGMLTLAVTVGAPAVSAQDEDVAGLLTAGVRCFGSNAKEDLGFNIRKLNATDEVLGAALNRVAADTAQCAPMREAAAELAATYHVTPPPSEEEVAAEAARQALAETLAEADRRVGAMKFEVGPPPRNMTRDRPSALGFSQ